MDGQAAIDRRERSRLSVQKAFSLSTRKPAPSAHSGVEAFKLRLTDRRAGPGRLYLEGRQIPLDLAASAGARFSTDWYGRPAVLFPIIEKSGLVIAWQGRHVDRGEPRMHDDGPKGAGVFATPAALEASPLVLVEAPIDALCLAACGIPAVALCGTSWPEWLPAATAFRNVALGFDTDAPGDDAALRLGPILTSFGARVKRWRTKDTKDWNEALCRGFGLPCWQCATGGVALYKPSHRVEGNGRWSCNAIHDAKLATAKTPEQAADREYAQPLPTAPEDEPTPVEQERDLVVAAPESTGSVIPRLSSRRDALLRRCAECARVLSVAAVRDVCGRCAALSFQPHPAQEIVHSDEAIQRARTLVVLDRRHYPRLQLSDGRHVGPGLEAWAPVLREMDAEELAILAGLAERTRRPSDPEPEL